VTRALKEWHVVAEAIARGDQVLTLRKGGIGEKAFAVADTTFWLYPTWEHQADAEVKRAWQGELARSNRERRLDGRIPIRCRCTVAGAWEVTDAATLDALDGLHLWSRSYVEARLGWRPTKPLTALLLRSSALVEPVLLDPAEAYGGCRSWIELQSVPAEADLIESLTDDAFALHADRVRAVLGAPTLVVSG
jgi:hypothetical protein